LTSADITAVYGKDTVKFGDLPVYTNKFADWGFPDLTTESMNNGIKAL